MDEEYYTAEAYYEEVCKEYADSYPEYVEWIRKIAEAHPNWIVEDYDEYYPPYTTFHDPNYPENECFEISYEDDFFNNDNSIENKIETKYDMYSSGHSVAYYLVNSDDENYKNYKLLYNVLTKPREQWTEEDMSFYEEYETQIVNGEAGFTKDNMNPYIDSPYGYSYQSITIEDVDTINYPTEKDFRYRFSKETGINDPSLEFVIDEDGHFCIVSGGKEIVRSDTPITTRSECMAFIKQSMPKVKEYSSSHLDLLFSGTNIDNYISFKDDLGVHEVKLSKDEWLEYEMLPTEEQKVEFLQKRIYGNVSTVCNNKKKVYTITVENTNVGSFNIDLPWDEFRQVMMMDESEQLPYLISKGYIKKVNNKPEYKNISIDLSKARLTSPDATPAEVKNNSVSENAGTFVESDNPYLTINWSDENGVQHSMIMTKVEWGKWKDSFDDDEREEIIVSGGFGTFENPNPNYVQKLITRMYSSSDVKIESSVHSLTFDDGRVFVLNDDEYREYLEQGTDYLRNFHSYNESLISSILNNSDKYGSSFDVRRYIDDKGEEYYVVYTNGQIVGEFSLTDILDEDGSVNPDALHNEIKEYVKEHNINPNILTTTSYQNNSKFELATYLISFDDEGEYKTIVKKLNETRNQYTPITTKLDNIGSELKSKGVSSASALITHSNSIKSIVEDTEYLESAVDKTVNIYRSCDSDLKDVFENGLVDEIFGKAGLYVYKENAEKNRYKDDNYTGNKRKNIKTNEGYLKVLHDKAVQMSEELGEMFEKWETWNNEGWVFTEEMYNNMVNDFKSGIIDKDFPSYTEFCNSNGLVVVKDENGNDIGFRINREQLLNNFIIPRFGSANDEAIELDLEEHCYSYLKSTDPNKLSDYDEYLVTAAMTTNPESRSMINQCKKFIWNEKFFDYALTDNYDQYLNYIRNNCSNFTDNDWQAFAELHDMDWKEAKNMQPNHLAMLCTLDAYHYGSIYAAWGTSNRTGNGKERDNGLPDLVYFNLCRVNPDFMANKPEGMDRVEYLKRYIEKNYPEYVIYCDGGLDKDHLDYTASDQNGIAKEMVDHVFRDEMEKEFGKRIARDELDVWNREEYDLYKEVIIGDSAKRREARERGLNQIDDYAHGGINLEDVCSSFVNSLWKNTVGGIGGLFDPSSRTFGSEEEYKHEYMIGLIEASRNPQAVALKYSRGEISKNEYDKILELSVLEVTDAAGNRITSANKVSEAAGKIVGNIILGKIAAVGKSIKGVSFVVSLLRAMNSGGNLSRTMSGYGYSDDDARIIGLAKTIGVLAENYTLKKILDAIWPDVPEDAFKNTATNSVTYNPDDPAQYIENVVNGDNKTLAGGGASIPEWLRHFLVDQISGASEKAQDSAKDLFDFSVIFPYLVTIGTNNSNNYNGDVNASGLDPNSTEYFHEVQTEKAEEKNNPKDFLEILEENFIVDWDDPEAVYEFIMGIVDSLKG